MLRNAGLALLCVLPLSSQALIISDVISVNKTLELGWHSYDFDLTKHGYNHLTDSIKYVELSYDFSKMVDEGDDFSDFDNYDTLESIQRNSYIFDGRIIYHDINPGIIKDRFGWTKDESFCQKENFDTGECELNLDLNGVARESLAVYNGNIFLTDETFSVDVDRIDVPEPSPFILFGLGLLAMCLARGRIVLAKK